MSLLVPDRFSVMEDVVTVVLEVHDRLVVLEIGSLDRHGWCLPGRSFRIVATLIVFSSFPTVNWWVISETALLPLGLASV